MVFLALGVAAAVEASATPDPTSSIARVGTTADRSRALDRALGVARDCGTDTMWRHLGTAGVASVHR